MLHLPRWLRRLRAGISRLIQKGRARQGAKAPAALLRDIGITAAAVVIGLVVIGTRQVQDGLAKIYYAQSHISEGPSSAPASHAVSSSRASAEEPDSTSSSAQQASSAGSETGSQAGESGQASSQQAGSSPSADSGARSSAASTSASSSSSGAAGSASSGNSAAGSVPGSSGPSSSSAPQDGVRTVTLTDQITNLPQAVQYFAGAQEGTVSGSAAVDTSLTYKQQYAGKEATLCLHMGYNTIVTKRAVVPDENGDALTLPFSNLTEGDYEVEMTVPGKPGEADATIARYAFSVGADGTVQPAATHIDPSSDTSTAPSASAAVLMQADVLTQADTVSASSATTP